MNRKYGILAFILLFIFNCGLDKYQGESQHDTIYQVSVLDALMAGVYDGEMTFGELKQHGDFGLGTFNALDGEMVAVDGIIYQIRSDGSVHEITDNNKTPFSVITFFEPDTLIRLSGKLDQNQVKSMIDAWLPSHNIPAAIKISGSFENVRTRSVPSQERPYPPLVDVLKNQPEFNLANISGTIIGFRMPVYMKSINAPNYHFHFLTDDKSGGGHLLDFSGYNLTIEIDNKYNIEVQLPHDKDFQNVNFEKDAGQYH